MKKIILISGKAESGKTTFANCCKDLLSNERITNMSYATTLKQYAIKYFGWDGNPATKPRELLQWLGTDVIREKLKKPLFHATRLAEDIEVIGDVFDYIFVDDCRFPNEYHYLKAKFPEQVIFVNVRRPKHISKLTDEQLNHPSETSLDDFKSYDFNIVANDIDELKLHTKYFIDNFLNCGDIND